MTKRCGRCGEPKPVEAFAWRRRKKGQRHNYRPPVSFRLSPRALPGEPRQIYRPGRGNKASLRIKRTALLLEYFSEHPCVDCGETDPLVLEFDHLRDKSFEIAAAIIDRGWETILAEIAKCDVVCANCHRRRTVRRRGSIRVLLTGDGEI